MFSYQKDKRAKFPNLKKKCYSAYRDLLDRKVVWHLVVSTCHTKYFCFTLFWKETEIILSISAKRERETERERERERDRERVLNEISLVLKFSIPFIFRTVIISLIYEQNAHTHNKIHVLLSTLCYMFRPLLRHLHGDLYRIYTIKYIYYYQHTATYFVHYCAIFRESFIVCFEFTIKFSLKMAQ